MDLTFSCTGPACHSTLQRLLFRRMAVAGETGSAKVQIMVMKPTGALTDLEEGIDNVRDVDTDVFP